MNWSRNVLKGDVEGIKYRGKLVEDMRQLVLEFEGLRVFSREKVLYNIDSSRTPSALLAAQLGQLGYSSPKEDFTREGVVSSSKHVPVSRLAGTGKAKDFVTSVTSAFPSIGMLHVLNVFVDVVTVYHVETNTVYVCIAGSRRMADWSLRKGNFRTLSGKTDEGRLESVLQALQSLRTVVIPGFSGQSDRKPSPNLCIAGHSRGGWLSECLAFSIGCNYISVNGPSACPDFVPSEEVQKWLQFRLENGGTGMYLKHEQDAVGLVSACWRSYTKSLDGEIIHQVPPTSRCWRFGQIGLTTKTVNRLPGFKTIWNVLRGLGGVASNPVGAVGEIALTLGQNWGQEYLEYHSICKIIQAIQIGDVVQSIETCIDDETMRQCEEELAELSDSSESVGYPGTPLGTPLEESIYSNIKKKRQRREEEHAEGEFRNHFPKDFVMVRERLMASLLWGIGMAMQ